jgi:hypothetical protein
MPKTLPRTVRRAVARPQAIARAIVKRTLGPGTRIIRNAAMQYSQRWEGITICIEKV